MNHIRSHRNIAPPDPVAHEPAAHDPFVTGFLTRLPAATARSFTEDQLDAIRMAFGARERGLHAVDIRFTMPVLNRYVVFLLGHDRRRRGRHRTKSPLRNLVGNGFAFLVLVMAVALPVLGFAWGIEALLISLDEASAPR